MDHAFEPHHTGVVCESINSDTTQLPNPLTGVFDFADWVLFPEEPEEGQGLSEMDGPPSTMFWHCQPENGGHPPTPPRRTSACSTSTSQVRLIGKTCKIRKEKTIEVDESRGVKGREINSVEVFVARSNKEIPIPRTPRPQRLPTPDLSNIEPDNFWVCCIDPNVRQVQEKGRVTVESSLQS